MAKKLNTFEEQRSQDVLKDKPIDTKENQKEKTPQPELPPRTIEKSNELNPNKVVEEEKSKKSEIKKDFYRVVRIENGYLFAINKDNHYIMLKLDGDYINTKFGDEIYY